MERRKGIWAKEREEGPGDRSNPGGDELFLSRTILAVDVLNTASDSCARWHVQHRFPSPQILHRALHFFLFSFSRSLSKDRKTKSTVTNRSNNNSANFKQACKARYSGDLSGMQLMILCSPTTHKISEQVMILLPRRTWWGTLCMCVCVCIYRHTHAEKRK